MVLNMMLFLAKDPNAPIAQNASIVGKFCESGDILIKDYDFPKTRTWRCDCDVINWCLWLCYGK